jgi:hypothetical protein
MFIMTSSATTSAGSFLEVLETTTKKQGKLLYEESTLYLIGTVEHNSDPMRQATCTASFITQDG